MQSKTPGYLDRPFASIHGTVNPVVATYGSADWSQVGPHANSNQYAKG